MRWIVGTAYLHSVMIQEKRGMLKVWNIVLILLTFLLTIFGTFITRSGLIASVHSFGESSLGWFFLLFLVMTLLISLSLLIYRLPYLKSKNQLDSLFSRESSFLLNNLLFVGIAFAVFWGTLFPIISEAVRGIKITVGAPFYNAVVTPIGLALLFLTGICPLIAWRKTTLAKFARKILFPSIFAILGSILAYIWGVHSIYPLTTLTFCIFVSTTLFLEFFNGTKTRHAAFDEGYPTAFWNLVAKNKRRYGGHIIHFGVVLIFMALSATLRFDGLSNYPTANRQKWVATLTLFNDRHKVGILSPEKSLYTGQEQPTTDVAIHSSLKEDLYVILAGYDENSATFKILVNPLVIWLWIGGSVMAFGTVIVMLPRRKKIKQTVANFQLAEVG
jgi:cytochrome c-type biogenesis protein CcmF